MALMLFNLAYARLYDVRLHSATTFLLLVLLEDVLLSMLELFQSVVLALFNLVYAKLSSGLCRLLLNLVFCGTTNGLNCSLLFLFSSSCHYFNHGIIWCLQNHLQAWCHVFVNTTNVAPANMAPGVAVDMNGLTPESSTCDLPTENPSPEGDEFTTPSNPSKRNILPSN